MVEARWHRLTPADPPGGLAFTFEDGAAYVLQFRFKLPEHPGFKMHADPITGKAIAARVEWSEWQTVDSDDAQSGPLSDQGNGDEPKEQP